MPLEKQIVTLPLTGGLKTSTGPLAIAPGSFLQLDDVRQEREHEWRTRQGITHLDALDDTGGPPLRSVELPGGGLIGLDVGGTNVSSGVAYSRNVPSTASRWTRLGTNCSQVRPTQWTRREVGADPGGVISQQAVSMAIGNGLQIVAWKAYLPSTTIRVTISSVTDGSVLYSSTGFATTTSSGPKCVYEDASKTFLVFWCEGANLIVAKWNANTAAFATSATLKTNSQGASQHVDARWYSGTNVTVVYRNASDNAHQLEVNPSTLALATDVDLAVNCRDALQLLPDPDGGTTRLIGVGTSTPTVRVLRTTAAGAISTNDLVSSHAASNIAGVAYQSGASWMIVYVNATTQQLHAAKKRSGVVGAVLDLTVDYGLGDNVPVLNSNAWREPNTDPMRFIAGLHVGNFGTSGDFQASYFEMALEYENGSSSISNRYTEPQARLLPLNAGFKSVGSDSLPQVTRVSANNFAVPLGRLALPAIAGGTVAHEYAIDAWYQQILTTSDHPNLGPGAQGPTSSYLPAGLLLKSVNGSTIYGHGEGAVPLRPTVALAAGAGLNSGQVYQYIVTVESYDESGDVWRSPPSLASAQITPSGANCQVTVTIRLSPFENANRFRAVKLWRTLGNGAVIGPDGEYLVQLVSQITKPCDSTNCMFTITDSTTDADLATSSFMEPGVPTTITPSFNHVAFFDGRMWGAERDFPSRLRFTRLMQLGEQPMFGDEFFKDINDEEGPITSLAALDDKLIVGKDTAIYFISAGGPSDDGGGSQYTVVKVNSEYGFETGTPYISTGSHVWFNHGGPKRIDRSLHVDDIGEPIERYFIRPLLQAVETPISYTYNHDRSEIRLLTTNYRFIFDIAHEKPGEFLWIRDTGASIAGTTSIQRLTGVGDMFFRSNGQVYWDYDTESTSNAEVGGAFYGVIRSPWYRLAGAEGFIRLYAERALFRIEPTGAVTTTPELITYYNDDDSLNDSTTYAATAGTSKQTFEARYERMRLTSFSLAIRILSSDLKLRMSQWSVMMAIKKSLYAQHGARA